MQAGLKLCVDVHGRIALPLLYSQLSGSGDARLRCRAQGKGQEFRLLNGIFRY